jgi:hypothetical protein
MAAKIFGVVKNNGSFCEIRYSWYIKHHHMLKRYFEHKRVRFQMDRVIRDHLESGYITKAEYLALKEPNEEIDYIIRYYPGPAAAESNSRIQTYIRRRKNLKKLRSQPQWMKTKIAPVQTVALSTTTARHHDLAYELISKFRLNPLTACSLVIAHEESVTRQLAAWRFRETKPRNPAGWIIQAIERKLRHSRFILRAQAEGRTKTTAATYTAGDRCVFILRQLRISAFSR